MADGRTSSAPPTIDELPRLSDDDREALESGYVAVEGVQSSEPPQPLQFIRRLENTNSLDLGRAVQALKQLCELADGGDRDSVPLDLLECVLRQLEHAEHAIERLCVEGLRAFGPSAEERRALMETAARR